jgi:nucleoside-diphosphate kinase
MEQTVVLIKPDAIEKGLIGEIISRFEKEGFILVAAKFTRLSGGLLETWYSHHKDKPFFPELTAFMTSTPVMAMLWEGTDIVTRVRGLCGPTDSKKAARGTIRGDYGTDIQRNAIHASENPAAAEKERDLIFSPQEIHEWKR